MAKAAATIVIIDGDASFCVWTERLVHSARLDAHVETFQTPREFLRTRRPGVPACVLLEASLPGMSGLEVQRELGRTGVAIPLIFVTGHGDIPMAVQAIKAGAVDFLTKPVRESELLQKILQAFQSDQVRNDHQQFLTAIRKNYELLTPCEREVMAHVVTGLLNKQTAAELGVSEKTIKFHRGHVMRKMKAQSVVDLARMAASL